MIRGEAVDAANLETLWRSKLADYQLLCSALAEENGGRDRGITQSDWGELRDFANRIRSELVKIQYILSGGREMLSELR